MPELHTLPAEDIVDRLIGSLYKPQYPSAGVFMRITDEETLTKARTIILLSELSSPRNLQSFSYVGDRSRPYQYHEFNMPLASLREFRDIYVSVIRRLQQLGIIQEIRCNYGY